MRELKKCIFIMTDLFRVYNLDFDPELIRNLKLN